jgi:hypothetical protein
MDIAVEIRPADIRVVKIPDYPGELLHLYRRLCRALGRLRSPQSHKWAGWGTQRGGTSRTMAIVRRMASFARNHDQGLLTHLGRFSRRN